MRFSLAVATLFAAIVSTSAQGLPACANQCLASADFDGCQPTDNSCLCKSQKFVNSTTTCIQSSCQGNDLQTAISASQQLCAKVGVTLSSAAPAATGTSPSGSGTAGATSSAPAASAAASGSSTPNAGHSNKINVVTGLAAIGLVAFAL